MTQAEGDRVLLPSLAIAASLFSQNIGAALAKNLFPAAGIEGVTALRVGLSALVLLLVWRPWHVRLSRRDLVSLCIYGATLGLMNLLIYHAFARIPIGIGIAIEVMGPLAVVLMSSRRPRDFFWAGLVIVGLYLLLAPKDGAAAIDRTGALFAAGAALCWAFYIVFGKKVSGALAGGPAVALGMLVAALLTVPIGIAHQGANLMTPWILFIGLGVALLSSALPYTLEMSALRHLPQRVFGILVSSAPAIGALAGFVVLGERLTGTQWLAIFCIIAASAGATATAQRGAIVVEDAKV